ncbi:phosphate signaling complex protein PhoU [Nocardia sp. NPDC051570]|uniref:phosphate signaling complex protein PhoU n=1 Tax=Nocardia sp. NPDC051570 TaxID=3364324 RepID=UPI0037AE4674
MREIYHRKLGALVDILARMAAEAGAAMQRATFALTDADLWAAEETISRYDQVASLAREAEEQAFNLLVLEAPVAGELRTVVAALQMVGDLDRMGVLATHIATAARRRHPSPVVPRELVDHFRQMGRIAVDLAAATRGVLETCDPRRARQLDADDDAMDALYRDLFAVLMNPRWPHGVQAAVDITLLSRYYERFADHAVAVGARVVFLATGDIRLDPAPGL